MAGISYVCLYMDYLQTLAPLTDAERGRIVMAMLTYADTGITPQFAGNERFVWPFLQAQIDRDIAKHNEKCAKNKENGLKGGRPSKNQTVLGETERFLEKPQKAKEKEKEKEKEKKKEKDILGADKPPTRPRFSPPTVEEVKAYCTEKGYGVDPQRFVDYYTSNGWMVGKNHMKDWKAAVRTWHGKENTNGKTESRPTWTIGTEV